MINAKIKKVLNNHHRSHSNTTYDPQLQKTIILCAQPQHQGTLMQPLHCDLQRLSRKHKRIIYAQRQQKLQLQNRISAPKKKHETMDDVERFYKKFLNENDLKLKNQKHHCRNLDAATPMRFTAPSCKRQKDYAHSRRSKGTLMRPLPRNHVSQDSNH